MTEGMDAFAVELARVAGLRPGAVEVGLTGPVAGAHVGPGMIGIALIRTA
jgi:fatty acid-binding protein DegV